LQEIIISDMYTVGGWFSYFCTARSFVKINGIFVHDNLARFSSLEPNEVKEKERPGDGNFHRIPTSIYVRGFFFWFGFH
jgi:hypothetical protein